MSNAGLHGTHKKDLLEDCVLSVVFVWRLRSSREQEWNIHGYEPRRLCACLGFQLPIVSQNVTHA